MSETQKDLLTLLMKYIKNGNALKGIVLFLQKEEQQIQMIQYLVKNKEKKITEEMILNKMEEITRNSISLDNSFKIPTKDSKGRKLTKTQQLYFRNSKVRDSKGNLEIVYHQTNADFTEFKNGFSKREFKNANLKDKYYYHQMEFLDNKKTDNSTLYRSKSEYKAQESSISSNNIPQNDQKVNSDISTNSNMQTTEKDTQELDNSSFSLKQN